MQKRVRANSEVGQEEFEPFLPHSLTLSKWLQSLGLHVCIFKNNILNQLS